MCIICQGGELNITSFTPETVEELLLSFQKDVEAAVEKFKALPATLVARLEFMDEFAGETCQAMLIIGPSIHTAAVRERARITSSN